MMYMYIHIYVYIYIYIYATTHISTVTYLSIYICIYISTHRSTGMYIYVHIRIYLERLRCLVEGFPDAMSHNSMLSWWFEPHISERQGLDHTCFEVDA